ncbi:MAG: glycosyltransferase family 4 protein [Anaerolineales bacterium]|nr:glycosyltransferase family 4 protein [Anaerolineales bacterium]
MLQPREEKAKKVLMVARAFPPFLPVGYSIRVIKFIKYLPALGWQPVVLSVDDQQEYETLPKVGSEALLSEIQPTVKIIRTMPGEPSLRYLQKEKEFGGKNFVTRLLVKIFGGARRWVFRNIFLPDRMITWLPFAVGMGRQVVKDEGIDVIFATCPPHSSALTGAVLKLFSGKPLVLDFRDDWIDTPWHLAKPAMVRMIEKLLEKWAVKMADKVILVTEWSRKAFQERYPAQPRDKFILISNGCDLGELEALKSIVPVHHTAKFTVVHAGSLNVSTVWGRSPAGLFQAIQKLLRENPQLKGSLVFKFAGDLPDEFRKLADEMGLTDVIRGLGHLPHAEVLRMIKSADLLLAMNYEGWATLIPGKIYEYWAVGGPPILLLSCPGAAADFVCEHALGIAVEPYDADGIQQAILQVYRQSKTSSPLRIKPDGVEAFDRKTLTHQLAQVLFTVS